MGATTAFFDTKSHVALIIDAGRVGKFVSLEVDFGLRLVLTIRELSHDFTINRTSEKNIKLKLQSTSIFNHELFF